MIDVTCQQCGVVFHARRKTAKFCDDACRKACHEVTRRGQRKREAQNRRTSPTQARRENEFFNSHMRMCEAYYGLPPMERPAYLLGLITKARQGDRVIRRILTNYILLRPQTLLVPKMVHWRGSSAYPTIAQEAHAFCKWHFDAGIKFVIDNSDHKPIPDARHRYEKMKQREYEERLAAIQKKVLPGLEERPKHTLKAVVCTIVGTRSPIYHEEQAALWGTDLPLAI